MGVTLPFSAPKCGISNRAKHPKYRGGSNTSCFSSPKHLKNIGTVVTLHEKTKFLRSKKAQYRGQGNGYTGVGVTDIQGWE